LKYEDTLRAIIWVCAIGHEIQVDREILWQVMAISYLEKVSYGRGRLECQSKYKKPSRVGRSKLELQRPEME